MQGDVKVVLAESYGYCWGVERAVQMAYEARKSYPESKLHITNEIIHNPSVNQVRLRCFLKRLDVCRDLSGSFCDLPMLAIIHTVCCPSQTPF